MASVGSSLLAAGSGGIILFLLYRLLAILGAWLLFKQAGYVENADIEIEIRPTGIKVRRSMNSAEVEVSRDDQAAT
ncbi:hypothetical protein [Streptosporangium sp. G12]